MEMRKSDLEEQSSLIVQATSSGGQDNDEPSNSSAIEMSPPPTMLSNLQRRQPVQRAVSVFAFAFVIAICTYFTFYTAPKPVWFHLHPLVASLGVYSFCSYATILKKQGKTRQHAYVMFVGAALTIVGVWIAFQDRSSRGKKHFKSTHAQVGLLSLALLVVFPMLSWILFNPDNGLLVNSQTGRKLHRYFGQFIMFISFAAFGLGIAKYEHNTMLLTIFLAMMGSITPLVLL